MSPQVAASQSCWCVGEGGAFRRQGAAGGRTLVLHAGRMPDGATRANAAQTQVHGFGASSRHWRSNIAELSQTHKVYAIDMLGFGRSDKPRIEYVMDVWRDQVSRVCKFCGHRCVRA